MLDIRTEPGPPLLTVLGGKLTTYRKLSETALTRLEAVLDARRPRWTADAPLPGGDLPSDSPAAFSKRLRDERPWLAPTVADRWANSYGTLATRILGDARSEVGLGEHFGGGLYAAELDYLRRDEWAVTAEDVLWRRTKLGLHLSAGEQRTVADYMDRCREVARAHAR